ncbi:MAG TPA: hypothetical protein VE910_04695 [Dongiaceae bacterium]|nr:hypothetical protein [Dongiaceae bacterium]
MRCRLGIGKGMWRRLAAAAAFLLVSAPALAQQFILPIESLDREVILRWTKAPGDTFTVEERRRVEQVGFFAFRSQGYLPNSFPNGAILVGRGVMVGGTGESDIEIGGANDLYVASSPPPPPSTPPNFDVAGVFQFGRDKIGVAFTQRVDPTTALTTSNYVFSPPIGVTGAVLQENGQTVILQLSGNLNAGVYGSTVSGVTNQGGTPLGSSGPFPMNAPDVPSRLNISDIYDNPSAYMGDTVAVFGQVTIPTGSRDITASNGFIQDGSGRGIRLRGAPVYPSVNSRGNAVLVRGVVGTQVGLEILGYTTTDLASGLPPLGAVVLPLLNVDDRALPGSFVQTTGHLGRVDANTDPDEVHYYTVSLDTLFAGYQIWRTQSENPNHYELLRTYSLLDSTWTFVGDERIFDDPDSVIARGSIPPDLRDGSDVEVPGPFNGFTYLYSLTTFSAVVDATVFPFRVTQFDTLRGEAGLVSPPVRPSQVARASHPLLSEVRVVPNPYNPAANFGQQVFPGAPRVQFVNLPAKAVIRIFTASGDEVRAIEKPENSGVDAVDWDLKNANGHDVASGIYVYTVEAGGEKITGHFVVAR